MKILVNFLTVSFLVLFPLSIFAQCSGGINGGSLPLFTSTYQTTAVTDGNYYTFSVVDECVTYDFSFCDGGGTATWDTQLTILDNAGVYAGINNDLGSCGVTGAEILAWSPPASGTYRLLVNIYNCAASGNNATLAIREHGSTLSTTGDYTLQSDAITDANPLCVQLTTNSASQNGCAWDVNSTLDFTSDFSFDFTVNLGANDAGADGMAFVIQNDPAGTCACGSNGNGFAAAGISNSLIIEIDTYLNSEDRDDGALMTAEGVMCAGGVEPDHLDIWLNGVINPGGACPNSGYPALRDIVSAQPLMNGASLYNIENGLDHILRISWDSSTNTFTASILNTALSINYGSVSISSPDFDPMTIFGTTTPFFGFTASTGGLTNEQSFCNPAILLPVEIISFSLNCNPKNTKLTWKVKSELNTDYFTVLRSIDGINYEDIGHINGLKSNSHNEIIYYFTDENRPNEQCYYTLSQTDYNGTTKSTGFVRVVNCYQNQSNIHPNPVKTGEILTIEMEKLTKSIVNIYNMNGEIVLHETFSGFDQVKLKIDLSSGLYHLSITNSNGINISSTKLVVIH